MKMGNGERILTALRMCGRFCGIQLNVKGFRSQYRAALRLFFDLMVLYRLEAFDKYSCLLSSGGCMKLGIMVVYFT